MPLETRTCRECRQTLSVDLFSLTRKWRRNVCTPCRSKQHYSRRIKKSYKIDIEQKNEMQRMQGGVCGICLHPATTLCVDHDHDTGEVRGLLCGSCNRGLGLLGDNVHSLTRAIEYLNNAEREQAYLVDTSQTPPIMSVESPQSCARHVPQPHNPKRHRA